mgnify:CR=1 FL=1
MTTWTLEHAKAIVAAWPEAEVQLNVDHWAKPKHCLYTYPTEHLGNPKHFRLPPKKRLVEWTASDVKPGMVFRVDGWAEGLWRTLYETAGSGIVWNRDGERTDWARLKEVWEWSLDASPGSWRPCAKEVEE